MFLVTTALEEFWNKEDKILFLGPWCTLYDRKEHWQNLDYEMLPNPWDDREAMHKAGEYCYSVYEHLMGELAIYCNRINEISYSNRFWEILLGPWLNAFITSVYDKYVLLNRALKYPVEDSYVLDSRCFITPHDFNEFRILAYDARKLGTKESVGDIYNLQLFSQILSRIECNFVQFTREVWQSSIPLVKIGMKDLIKFGLAKGLKKNRVFISGQVLPHHVAKIRKASGEDVQYGPFVFPMTRRTSVLYLTRLGLCDLVGRDKFERVLISMLPVNFPTIYLEGFESMHSWALKKVKSGVPKILCHIGGLADNESMKYLTALCVERGTKLVMAQHGAGYGMSRFVMAEKYDQSIADKHFVWGWGEGRKTGNVSSVLLSNMKKTRSSRGEKILIMGVSYPRCLYSFDPVPVGSQLARSIRTLLYFLASIGSNLRKRTVYRPYSYEYGWVVHKRIIDRYPEVQLDMTIYNRWKFTEKVKNARIVVFDSVGTGLLEAMAVNIPVVAFSKFYEPRQGKAFEQFEQLKYAGIFHVSSLSAAIHVKERYDDVNKWWLSDRVQEIRKFFVNRFALNSSTWAIDWAEALENVGEHK